MSANAISRWRNLAGVLLKDYRRYRRALRAHEAAYLGICNRSEVLELAPSGQGYRCDWQWTSDLHAPKYLPALGLGLMKRALADHPIRRVAAPEKLTDTPDVSFIIGHRAMDRLLHLLATLECIAGQQGATIECLVVEQDAKTRIERQLPAWVKHVYTPPPSPDMPFCRSWAFNLGVKHARAKVVVLHDNDMLLPTDYAVNILEHIHRGYEVVNLKRFIFYLTERHTKAIFLGRAGLTDEAPLSVMQNLEGGGSIAVTRKAYYKIGGMDEAFIGWGGEDNEFWERAQTLKLWPFGYLPIVHLWHAPQSGKLRNERSTASLYKERSAIPAAKRIAELTARGFGNPTAPYGCSVAKRA